MAWLSSSDLPPGVRKALPPAAQQIFRVSVNVALDKGLDQKEAEVTGWMAVRKAGYTRGVDGAWDRVAKEHKRTLYVSRPLLQPDALIRWAQRHRLPTTLKPSDMHVTVAYSKTEVDWDRLTESYSDQIEVTGGPRFLKKFGLAIVLRFTSSLLIWRHQEFRDLGASWDHPEYLPHVTLGYLEEDQAAPDLEMVPPFLGPLVFGQERFAEVDEDWRSKL